jgi:hypothetical protein
MSKGSATSVERGRVERLTSTTVFVVLVAMSVLVVSPFILMGLVMGLMGVMRDVLQPGAMAILGLAGGGFAGLIGLVLSRTRDERLRRASIEAAIVLLATGMVTALIVCGAVVSEFLDFSPWDREEIPFVAAVLVPHAVLIVAACGRIQSMKRRYAARMGEAFDTVPVSLLLLALGQAAVGATVTLGLSTS